MTRMAAILVITLLLPLAAACSPEPAPTNRASQCATDLFTSYNPKDRDQCIAVCIKCEKGVMTTCSTSCMLKGAK